MATSTYFCFYCLPVSVTYPVNFDVLLTVHLSIFILVINQLDAQNLFCNKLISYLYMFRAPCAHRQKVKLYYTASGIIIPIGGRPVQRTATYSV